MKAGNVSRIRLSDLAAQIIAAVDIAELVAELLSVRRVGRELTGCCPFHEDHTPSFNLSPETGKFYCFGCGAKGDVFDLVGRVWGVQGLRRQLVAVARWGGLAWAMDRLEQGDGPSNARAPMPEWKPPPKRAARKPIDRGEVAALWEACTSVTHDGKVADYLRSRHLDPLEVDERGLARGLPERLKLPKWASRKGIAWNRSGHRLVVPLFTALGELASLTARRIVVTDEEIPKALFPPGPRAGLLLADEVGRWLLRVPHEFLGTELWIAEGLTDHLALACDYALDDETVPGTLGIVGPKSWSKAAADRVPDRVCVVLAVDADAKGDAYVDEIVRTFEGRPVHIDRWRPKQSRGQS
jgi:hypothetical protein